MSNESKEKSKSVQFIQSICSLSIVGVICYSLIYGVELASSAIAVSSLAGLVLPALIAEPGVGIAEILTGVLETFVEGLISAVTGVIEAITSIF
ncbi:hypothetical protein ACJJID_09385 [Microbulbifer sp. CnH-101-G]|uniref:hypothetical protein n=1 Tax=Microbulbifer sp. CnH-101-G TaxID=3243393 RepID=UPI0040394CF5